MLVVIVIAVAAVVVLWGWSATGAKDYLQVSTLVDDSSGGSIPAKYLNKSIEVQGVVVGWEGYSDMNFSLADKSDSIKTIQVELVGALPSEFANGKTAVVKGDLEGSLPLKIVASEITIGCASRY
jgi:cytochrome c-type biogenesis protein CcmE